MTIFELLFVGFALASVLAILAVVAMFASRRRREALQVALILAGAWTVYLVIVGGVAASSHQRIVKMNQDHCFDEMCFAAVGLQIKPELGPVQQQARAKGEFYIVTIRVSNHARGYRTERELGIRARLWRDGTYYEVSPSGRQAYERQYGPTPKLTDPLLSDQSFLCVLVFDVPIDVPTPGLVLDHGITPGYFVIGESPKFHKPTVLRLDSTL